VAAFKVDYRSVPLEPVDRAMLDYVAKLTLDPGNIERADFERMRELGLDDDALVEVNQVTGFFAWCIRTVQGLGVQLEDFWDEPGATNV
jgi:uncharacterized protein YciW